MGDFFHMTNAAEVLHFQDKVTFDFGSEHVENISQLFPSAMSYCLFPLFTLTEAIYVDAK